MFFGEVGNDSASNIRALPETSVFMFNEQVFTPTDDVITDLFLRFANRTIVDDGVYG